MARTPEQDYLQGFRFKVSFISDVKELIGDLRPGGRGAAGFSYIELPEMSLGSGGRYREGHWSPWAVSVPGIPDEMTANLRRGVILGDTAMYNWFMLSVGRSRAYRADLIVNGFTDMDWVLADCYCSRLKPPIFDATSSDITVWDMTLVVDRIKYQQAQPLQTLGIA